MKYELTPSISAKCGLLTSKVNFVVTIAFRYALCATYFITQRAEAQALLAAQRKIQFTNDIVNTQTYTIVSKTLRSNHRLLSALCVESSALLCQCVESIKRQWQTCLMMGF
ncbi:MAG: hypothetical protein MJY52_04780 [Bacteroidaceae bacterium]|nr:hypothetical protein [Bacteroidaceae bacterium]